MKRSKPNQHRQAGRTQPRRRGLAESTTLTQATILIREHLRREILEPDFSGGHDAEYDGGVGHPKRDVEHPVVPQGCFPAPGQRDAEQNNVPTRGGAVSGVTNHFDFGASTRRDPLV